MKKQYLIALLVIIVLAVAWYAWTVSTNNVVNNQAVVNCVVQGGSYDVVTGSCRPAPPHLSNANQNAATPSPVVAKPTVKATVTDHNSTVTVVNSSSADTSQTLASLITGTIVNMPTYYETSSSTEIIYVANPGHNSSVTSPLQVTGAARGSWYFEGQFPIILTNSKGIVIARTAAKALTNWMSNDLVTYTATLTFPIQPSGSQGTLILKNDNPSGDPKNDKTAYMTVFFR